MVIFAAPVFALVLSMFGYGVVHEQGRVSEKQQSSVLAKNEPYFQPEPPVVAVASACLDQAAGCRHSDATEASTAARFQNRHTEDQQ